MMDSMLEEPPAAILEPAGSGFSLSLPEGRMVFSEAEGTYFNNLFTVIDSDEDEEISGSEGAAFLRRADLRDDALREVWRLACGGRSRPKLGKADWFVACKLVAFAQQGMVTLTRDPLFRGETVGLPNFGLWPEKVDYSVDSSESFPKESCHISVSDPRVVGSGMSKYTVYKVSVKTSLAHFQRSESKAIRRYSDFRWLNDQFKLQFPVTVIPPLPQKKMIGNLDTNFVEERRLALEQYLGNVARHPKLSTSMLTQVFLDSSQKGLSLFKSMLEVGPPLSSGWNSIYSRASKVSEDEGWFSKFVKSTTSMLVIDPLGEEASRKGSLGLEKLGIPHSQMSIYHKRLNKFERNLQDAVNAVERYLNAMRGIGYEVARISAHFSEIAEYDKAESLTNDGQENEFSSFMAQIGRQFDVIANHKQDMNDEVLNKVLSPIKYQMKKIKAVRKVLRNHDAQFTVIREAHEHLARCRKSYDTIRASSSVDSNQIELAKYEVSLAESRVKRAEDGLVEMAESIEKEMKKIVVERRVDLSSIVEQFCKLQVQLGNEQKHYFLNLRDLCCKGDTSLSKQSLERLRGASDVEAKWFQEKRAHMRKRHLERQNKREKGSPGSNVSETSDS